MTRSGVSVAIELANSDEQSTIIDRGSKPRIFKAFPLSATGNFCVPCPVNSESFEPRPERDTLSLLATRDGKNENMTLMETACELAVEMLAVATSRGWKNAVSIAKLNPIVSADWIDEDWLRELLKRKFVEPIRVANVMVTELGDTITPARASVPLLDPKELCGALWDVAVSVSEIAERLPPRDESEAWAEAVESWAAVLRKPAGELDESLTLNKLCERIGLSEDIDSLQNELMEGTDAVAWLNELHSVIVSAKSTELFESEPIIPSQNGYLQNATKLHLDQGIHEELKKIAESLGIKVRDGLVDLRIDPKIFKNPRYRTQADVLTEVISLFKNRSKSLGVKPDRARLFDRIRRRAANVEAENEFSAIAVRLFTWLVQNNQIDELDGLPVVSRAFTSENPSLIVLAADRGTSDDVPLGPVGCWPDRARHAADLFSKRFTLSDEYFSALPDPTTWSALAAKGYVRVEPLYRTQRTAIQFIPDELPAADTKGKHSSKEPTVVSALAFFEKEESGLHAARRSKARAIELLLFISNYVLAVEPDALKTDVTLCECNESHKYYFSSWISPMLERRWVPLGDNKQVPATAESVAQLFEGRDDELRELISGNGKALLRALGISLADLRLRAVARDEDTRVAWINIMSDLVQAAQNDLGRVKLLAEEMKETPGLIDDIAAHRDRKEIVRRNRKTGELVETVLEELLEDYGISVDRTGVGSDFEISQDYLIDEEEVMLSLGERSKILVEVKSTTQNVVRMTVAQGRLATERPDQFVLCVVPLDEILETTPENLKECCRFVVDIGRRIQPIWEEYTRFEETKGEVCTPIGDIELYVEESQVRFAVRSEVWISGLPFNEFVGFVATRAG
jgi:hypothetical protein